MNRQTLINHSVEDVESVEILAFPGAMAKKEPHQASTGIEKRNVDLVVEYGLSSYFSTLSTKLKSPVVENQRTKKPFIPSDLRSIPQVPQFPREQNSQVLCVFEWLQIVVEEGHIEPSQPCVGRILGWPLRSFHINSLRVDFLVWCRKKEVPQFHIADSQLFFSLLDEVFDRKGERYEFPSLVMCRGKFSELRRKYESFAAR
jgi:hypothetical protein